MPDGFGVAVVREEGNPRALEVLGKVFELRPHFEWRGLGFISQSALKLRPEFADFEIEDLNPRHFVQKHLLNDLDLNGSANGHTATAVAASAGRTGSPALLPGEEPPFDMEAT